MILMGVFYLADLSSGFEYNIKLAFLNSKSIKETSKKNYYFELKTIMQFENKCKHSIFKLNDPEIKEFIVGMTPEKLRKLSSVATEYYNFYKKNVDSSISNKLCTSFKNSELVREIYRKEVEPYILSLSELNEILALIDVDYRERTVAILLYMGFSKKDILNLQVKHIDFEKKEISYSNKVYRNIDKNLFSSIIECIENVNNNEEYIIKDKRKNKKKISDVAINDIIIKLNKMALKNKVCKKFDVKSLNDAGAISYYCTHEEKFRIEDSSVLKVKLYKAFEIMRRVSASRFSICEDEFSHKLDILKPKIKDKKIMFDVDISVTANELKKIRANLGLNKSKSVEKNVNLLDEIKKIYPEDEREKDDKQDERHNNQKKKGDENENLVKSILENRNSITCIKFMKDYAGYDIQFKLCGELHRVEVKTLSNMLGNMLEFHITINELNNIFNSDRKNYIIAIVQNEDVRVIEDIENTLEISKEFIYRFLYNKSIQMVSETFKIRLDNNLFKKFKTLQDYLDALETS